MPQVTENSKPAKNLLTTRESTNTVLTKKLEQDYAGRITFVARNFPPNNHPPAVPAAQAAEAAAVQGKYREMYDALYDTYASWALQPDGEQQLRALIDQELAP
jgi:protein-disulfide isomerase